MYASSHALLQEPTAVVQHLPTRAQIVRDLLECAATPIARADPLRPLWASLIAGRQLGQGVLDATLGLSPALFDTLRQDYFPGAGLALLSGAGEDIVEFDDLRLLLQEYRAGVSESEGWIASTVAYSCCGRDHLWQDLGLANRTELSLLMQTAFPGLAALNTGDMKWKKFIYRHYCSREGIYVCPAPSCGACGDYSKCFAKEE
jgi:nitrogen fixation protein NifQ